MVILICFAALCAAFLQPLVCGLNLRPSIQESTIIHWLIVELFSLFDTFVW
jgi:hypothetical protein